MTGHRLGRAIREVVADTVIHVRSGMMRHENEAKARHVNGLMEQWETDLRDAAGPQIAALLDNPGVPQELKDMLKSVTAPTHFSDFIVSALGIVGSIFTLLPSAGVAYAQNIKNQVFHHDPVMPADPGGMVSGLATHRVDPGAAYSALADSGYGQGAVDLMVDAQRGPLDPSQIIALIRKGQSDEATLMDAAIKSGIHPQWAPGLAHLVYGKPDPALATEARVRGHIDAGTHADILKEHGIDPSWSEIVYQTAGQPPGIQELVALWNRGVISEATVEQAILESHYNNKYVEAIKQFRVYLPPPRSIVPMFHSGAITEERARTLLMQHGLSSDDAEAFIREAKSNKTQAAKHATASLIQSMYEDYEMDRANAERMLSNLGYDAESIVLELGRAEALRGKKLRDAAVSRIRAQYDKRHLNRQDASNALDRAGVPPQARDQMLLTWDVEREVGAPTLSTAQLGSAFKKGALTDQEYQDRLLALGYSPTDVRILMETNGATPTGI